MELHTLTLATRSYALLQQCYAYTHTHTHTGPSRPLSTAPTTTNITSTSVNVSWQFPGGYVDFYNIQCKLSNVEWTSPDDVRDINVMGFRTSVSINGLLPNTTYDLCIRTRNANGESEWSPVATFTTRRKNCLSSNLIFVKQLPSLSYFSSFFSQSFTPSFIIHPSKNGQRPFTAVSL